MEKYKEEQESVPTYVELMRRKEELLSLISDAETEVFKINNEMAKRQQETFGEDNESIAS